MPSRIPISRQTIIHLRLVSKLTWSQIVTQTGVSERTAKRWVKAYKEEGRVTPLKSPGRPRTVRTPANLKRIRKHFSKPSRPSLRSAPQLGKKDSLRLALIQDLNFSPRKTRKVPKLNDQHRKKRLAFAKKHLKTDISNWAFSDEKRFVLKGNVGSQWVWVENVDDRRLYCETQKYGQGSVEVWGAITKFGRPQLHFIDRTKEKKFTAKRLRDEVLNVKVPELDLIFRQHRQRNWLFQQDGDSKHNAKLVRTFLEASTPTYLGPPDWPANSPDLNIIENVWGILANRVQHRRPRTVKGLKRVIEDEWQKLCDQTIKNLYDSWSDRMKAVIESQGGNIKY